MRKVTEFEQRVYDAVSAVPLGRVTTYKKLADSIGCGSSQAVGQALKRNPFAPDVPCHRVISSQLKIAGYLGQIEGEQVAKKLSLLRREGVLFSDDGKLLASDQLI